MDQSLSGSSEFIFLKSKDGHHEAEFDPMEQSLAGGSEKIYFKPEK